MIHKELTVLRGCSTMPNLNEKNTLTRPELSKFRSPNNYAVIEVGGTQKIVEEGRYYTCNHLPAEISSKIKFGRVLAVSSDGNLLVGNPWVEHATVTAEIIDEFLSAKTTVYKMKRKKHYRSKNGHRQSQTRFLVSEIKLR